MQGKPRFEIKTENLLPPYSISLENSKDLIDDSPFYDPGKVDGPLGQIYFDSISLEKLPRRIS